MRVTYCRVTIGPWTISSPISPLGSSSDSASDRMGPSMMRMTRHCTLGKRRPTHTPRRHVCRPCQLPIGVTVAHFVVAVALPPPLHPFQGWRTTATPTFCHSPTPRWPRSKPQAMPRWPRKAYACRLPCGCMPSCGEAPRRAPAPRPKALAEPSADHAVQFAIAAHAIPNRRRAERLGRVPIVGRFDDLRRIDLAGREGSMSGMTAVTPIAQLNSPNSGKPADRSRPAGSIEVANLLDLGIELPWVRARPSADPCCRS